MSRLGADAAFVLSAPRCRQLAMARNEILAYWQRSGAVPPGLREDLDEMVAVAREWEVRVRPAAAPRAGGSNPGANPVRVFDGTSGDAEAVYIEMREACERLGMTEAGVRKALSGDRIIGRQRGGPGCKWQIDLESVLRYAATRNATSEPRKEARSA